MPRSSSTTISPSTSAVCAGRLATAAAMFGNFSVQSRPLRVSRRTLPWSSLAWIRYPSNLTSWIQPAPDGAWACKVASDGGTKPGSGAPDQACFLPLRFVLPPPARAAADRRLLRVPLRRDGLVALLGVAPAVTVLLQLPSAVSNRFL